MTEEEKKKRLQALKNLKFLHEAMLEDLQNTQANQDDIDAVLEALFNVMESIKKLENKS
jgi:hypothetical protein